MSLPPIPTTSDGPSTGDPNTETPNAIAPDPAAASDDRPSLLQELSIGAATFGAIFLAEVGDKTQVAVLLMSAESHRPWTVFAGAAIALIATSLVGVLLGRWLSKHLSEAVLEIAVGALLLVVAAALTWDVVVG